MQTKPAVLARVAALAAALLALGGCALPPAVAIASYVIDVGSFVATGKTATDHGISAVAQQDCALMRVFEGGICREDQDYAMADAGVLEPLPPLEPAGPQALVPGNLQPLTPTRGSGLQVAGLAPVTAVLPPTPITPLAAGGDLARLPQVELLPDARFLSDDVWLAERTLTRESLLDGARYLADGLAPPLADNGG